MAITFFGAAASPADNGSQDDTAARAITPPASMVAGDLVVLATLCRNATETLAISQAGGQSWTSETLRQSGSSSSRLLWCRYNGTWSANPSVTTTGQFGTALSLVMAVFRPTAGSNTWAVDVAETFANVGAPVSPFDVTATGKTAVAASTVSLFAFTSIDDNSWALQTGGFSNAGSAQYRNTASNDISVSLAYKIQTSAGATGNVTNRQTANGGDAARWHAITFKEQSSGVTIADAGDELYYDGETGVTIAGTSFGASQGAGRVVISPADDIDDAGAVEQTVTAWADTAVEFTADLATFTPFAQLYLFVEDNGGTSNSSGHLVKRESRMFVRETLEDLAGSPIASESNIRYRVTDATINGTALLTGLTETTDGSGDIEIGPYTLTEGGDLAPGDDVWLVLAIEGASQAAS
jgi:hypothetical protein